MQESGEMYLENIIVLREKIGQVRAIDIVNHTGYTKPSISRALGLLKKSEMITVDKNGYITLTDEGEEIAKKILERHKLLTRFFTGIGVSPDVASADACRVEHIISDETFERLKDLASKKD